MIVINLGASIVMYTILIGFVTFYWSRGFLYMLSLSIFITLGYLLAVQSGDYVPDIINRIYTNGPKIAAFLLGRDPTLTALLPPLIPPKTSAPLIFRIFVFFGMVSIGIGYAWPWEKTALKSTEKARSMRVLGALGGLYIGILTISAVSNFWRQSPESIRVPNKLSVILSGMYTYNDIIPVVIALYMTVLIAVIIVRIYNSNTLRDVM